MRRMKGKGKIGMIMAVVVSAVLVAFIPNAVASVTDLTITPNTSVAGKVVAYNITLNATPAWHTLNITIPAGFEAVAPTTSDQLLAKGDVYCSDGSWCGNITIKSSSIYDPSEWVDIVAYNKSKAKEELSIKVNYSSGASIGFKAFNAGINLTLPTETKNGSLNISLPSGKQLTNVTVSLGAFVRNPKKAGNYTFVADGKTATVTIKPDVDVKLAVYPDTPKTANGEDVATIYVYAQDQYGNNVTLPSSNIKEGELSIATNSTTVSWSITFDNANGRFIVNMTDTQAEAVEITAMDIGTTGKVLEDGVGVQVFILPVTGIQLTTDKPEIVANNSDTTIIKAQLVYDGTPVQKVASITFQSLNNTLANVIEVNGVPGTSGYTYPNGTAFAKIRGNSSYALGTVRIRAYSEGKYGTIDLELVVGPPNNTQSTIAAYNETGVNISGGNATVSSKVLISVTLKDEIPTHPPLSGETVKFSIVESPGNDASLSETTVVTDANGHANTTLTLSTKRGWNVVRVVSVNGDVNKTVRVWGDPAVVILRAAVDNATVATNVSISARLLDPINGTPINGTNVTFSVVSPGGDAVVSPAIVSTVNGYANTTLTLSTKIGNNTVRVISTRYDVNKTVNVTGIAGNATQLNLTTDKVSLPIGATATITARLLDAYGNPTALNATGGTGPVNISFIPDTTEYGNVTGGIGPVDSGRYNLTVNGVATVQFVAGGKSGLTRITASAEGLASDSVEIFTGTPVGISLTASPDNILYNQSKQNSTITAQLLDAYGTPIGVAGWKIVFLVDKPNNVTLTNSTGVTGHPVVEYTDANGRAWINLTSIKPIIEVITVTAMPEGLPSKQVEVQIRGPAAQIELSAEPSSGVVANGTDKSVITAQLKDAEGHNVAEAGKVVYFGATNGTLSAYTVLTNSSGAATTNLTWTSTTGGIITVYAACGTFTDSVTVEFVPPPVVKPRNFSVSITPSNITVNKSTTVYVNVSDAETNMSVEGATVNLSGCGYANETTTNASGIATFEVNATSTGYITVTVSKTGYSKWTKEKGIVVLRPFPGCTNPPTDPDDDGLYEDINGNGRKDYDDLVKFFNYLEWVKKNEPVECFDFNGNGRIDYDDIVELFEDM